MALQSARKSGNQLHAVRVLLTTQFWCQLPRGLKGGKDELSWKGPDLSQCHDQMTDGRQLKGGRVLLDHGFREHSLSCLPRHDSENISKLW